MAGTWDYGKVQYLGLFTANFIILITPKYYLSKII